MCFKMKLKRMITGSALSLAMLLSAAPAFAQSPSESASAEHAVSSKDFSIQEIKLVQSPNGVFAAEFTQDGKRWIFKHRYYDDSRGIWIGVYERAN